MPRGGARVRSGPARNPNALRSGRSDHGGFIHKPNAPRDEPPPHWPLPSPNRWERERWAIEWQRPVARFWEDFGLEVQVAMYLRTLYRATRVPRGGEKPPAAGLMDTASTLQDRLGLTLDGRAKNRWIIDDEPAPAAPRRTASSSAKERLSVIRGGADAAAS